jgi:thioredoxin-like negative regulator of GroEL
MSDVELLPRVSDENYPEYMKADAALILFKIASCQQCDEFEPVVEEAARQHGGKVRFGKALLHIPGACREIKRQHRFDSFPTTHFYKKGQLVYSLEGRLSQEELQDRLKRHLL